MGVRSNVVILKNMFADRAIYCPCCGKDIKVIEEDDDSADDIWKVETFTVTDGCLFGIVDLKYHCEKCFCNHCGSEFVEFEKMSSVDRDSIKSLIFFIINIVLIYVSVRYFLGTSLIICSDLRWAGAFLWSSALVTSLISSLVCVSKNCHWHLFPDNIHKYIYQNNK